MDGMTDDTDALINKCINEEVADYEKRITELEAQLKAERGELEIARYALMLVNSKLSRADADWCRDLVEKKRLKQDKGED